MKKIMIGLAAIAVIMSAPAMADPPPLITDMNMISGGEGLEESVPFNAGLMELNIFNQTIAISDAASYGFGANIHQQLLAIDQKMISCEQTNLGYVDRVDVAQLEMVSLGEYLRSAIPQTTKSLGWETFEVTTVSYDIGADKNLTEGASDGIPIELVTALTNNAKDIYAVDDPDKIDTSGLGRPKNSLASTLSI